jgi:hypothetical protein
MTSSSPCTAGTGAELLTLEGIAVAFGSCLLKKVSNDPFFFIFDSLSHLAFALLQILYPQCHFSRFAMPTGLQWT